MVILRPTNLHWIKGNLDDPIDLCAHSGVEFRVGDETLLSQDSGDWTVSAATLYLLRTLSESHTKDNPVGDQLFPCCGHCMWDIEGNEDVVIVGCPNGADFEVVHDGNEIVIGSVQDRTYRIPLSEWRAAVRGFSDAVRSFYAASSPKQPADQDEEKGFKKFMDEWDRRRISAESNNDCPRS